MIGMSEHLLDYIIITNAFNNLTLPVILFDYLVSLCGVGRG